MRLAWLGDPKDMPRLIGILAAVGTVVAAAGGLLLMLWIIGQPELVLWWRAEYVIGGFVAILIGAIALASRSRKAVDAASGKGSSVAVPLVKGIGVALAAALLLLALYSMV